MTGYDLAHLRDGQVDVPPTRDECDKLGLQVDVQLPQEWLAGHLDRLSPTHLPASLRLMLHCTERAMVPRAGAGWHAVFCAAGTSRRFRSQDVAAWREPSGMKRTMSFGSESRRGS